MNRDEIAPTLWNVLETTVTDYASSPVKKVSEHTDKTAFFPVGTGLHGDGNTPIDILVLGQDFGTSEYTDKIIRTEKQDTDAATWRNMLGLFNEVGIQKERCFYSNVFMGLRVGTLQKMTGKYPGYINKNHAAQNVEFLRKQIEIIHPRAIITLGIYPSQMLATASSDNKLAEWSKLRALKGNNGFVTDVMFGNIKCCCVALVHPSMRNSNVRWRKYNNPTPYTGNDAEVMMLREMLTVI